MVMIIALLSLLIGALLELRWNVFVLAPVFGVALPLVALIGIENGEGAGSLPVDLLVAVICTETGYMARLIAKVLGDVTRSLLCRL